MKRSTPEIATDPFAERTRLGLHREHDILGARFVFESNRRSLLQLVDHAYGHLPRHRLTRAMPRIAVHLRLTHPTPVPAGEPARIQTLSGGCLLCGATHATDSAVISPAERTALVLVSQAMLRYPYHLRYELIEFSVATLAARVQALVPLHAACFGRAGRGLLLIGDSGAGKTTLSLHALLRGLEFVAEDSLFVAPRTMLATGVANFLHVRREALRFLPRIAATRIRRAPVITRRGGAHKFELDLRREHFTLAPAPLRISASIVLTAKPAKSDALLRPLESKSLIKRLEVSQPYASGQAGWALFAQRMSAVPAYELRRGNHPEAALDALQSVLDGSANGAD